MKKRILVLSVLLFASTNGVSQANWNSFSSETGKFSVNSSGNISESSRTTDKSTSFKITILDGNMSYLISSTHHQNDLESDIDNLLSTSINSFSQSVKGDIISQHDVERGNSKGKYADVLFDEGEVRLAYFVFIKGLYQYQVMAYASKQFYNVEDANRFFRSFKILK